MGKPDYIELGDGRNALRIPILFEDRSALAIDKPAGWLLAPISWQRTGRNLNAAIVSSLNAGDFWARSRNLKFLRFVHRLDAETTGIVLFVKSPGAMDAYSNLFENRATDKRYLAVVHGIPRQTEWTCRQKIGPDPRWKGRMQIDARQGKEAETTFRLLETREDKSLVEARPLTGRTHQLRLHLTASNHAVVGDPLYGKERASSPGFAAFPLALRAVRLAYRQPFTGKNVVISAETADFLRCFGFEKSAAYCA